MSKGFIGKLLIGVLLYPIISRGLITLAYGVLNPGAIILIAVVVLAIILTTVLSVVSIKFLKSRLSYFFPQVLLIIGTIIYLLLTIDLSDAWAGLITAILMLAALYVSSFSIPTFLIYQDKQKKIYEKDYVL